MAVVLVEDHDNLRFVLTKTLEEAGFDVIALSCAEEIDETPGARLAEAYIIDLNLPGEDGISLVQRIRTTEPSAFIVITTARTEIHHRIVGYESGSDIYMAKPVSSEELTALLRAHLSRLETQASHDWKYWVNTSEMMLYGPTGQVKLTHFEMRILSALAGANGRRLESWQLLALLYPNDDTGSIESLQVRLSLLRRKFREIGAQDQVIRSERGVGYSLCVDVRIE